MAKTLESAIDFDHLSLYDNGLRTKVAKKTDLPTKLGDLQNDQNYQSADQVTNKINDALESYTPTDEMPENLSEFFNDEQFISDSEADQKITSALESSGFQKAADVKKAITDEATEKEWQTATQVTNAINDAIKDVVGVKFEVVQDDLPAEGQPGVIYLKRNSGTDDYAEYIWITTDTGGKFEMLGTAGNVDLTSYVKESDITVASNAQITGLLAGWE